MKHPVPTKFICIAPEERALVLDYLKVSEQEQELAKLHLQLCLVCQETFGQLREIDQMAMEGECEDSEGETNDV